VQLNQPYAGQRTAYQHRVRRHWRAHGGRPADGGGHDDPLRQLRASEVEATIFGEVGQGDTTIVVKKDDAVVSATNPEWTITNTMIANYPVTYTVGELQVFEVSFTGGTWVRDITP